MAHNASASLIAGIVADVRELLRQELALASHGLSQELKKAKQAVLLLRLGIASATLSALLLVLMLVHLLHGVLPEGMPLWSCYGIVGAALTILASGLFFLAKRKACQAQRMPAQTMATMAGALQHTVQNNVDSVTLPLQRHPWTTLASSLAAGYLLGRLMSQRQPASGEAKQSSAEALPHS
jgi:hypothetical protein